MKPKSILKRTKKADPIPAGKSRERSITPPPRISRAMRDEMAEEDARIAEMERKLGIKGKKKSSSKDEFADLLGEVDEMMEDEDEVRAKRKTKAEGDEWLDKKRAKARLAKAQKVPMEDESEEEKEEDDSLDDDSDDDGASDMSLDGAEFQDDESKDDSEEPSRGMEELDVDNDFDGFDSDEEDDEREEAPKPRVRENPYIAPAVVGEAAPAKYIPPSMRKPASSDSELLLRLRRQTQGLVNRLTEANLIYLLGDIEKLYRENARQHVTSILVDLLLTSVCEPTSLPDTLIILPAGFIAAIYKIIGPDFGAQVIEKIVELFDEHYSRAVASSKGGPQAATSDTSKETSNLIMLLAELYNFQVIGSNLIFDYVRMFLETLSELNTELLLKVIRTSGPQLRQDDSSSLKGIVAMLRPAVASVGEENVSVRTKFMIETITDLKNNKMKTGQTASSIASEHTIRMKKALGTLNNTRTIKGSEPLRINLKDIQDSDKKGKWWLVGASWAGPAVEDTTDPTESSTAKPKKNSRLDAEDAGTTDLAQLAREQRMNTEVRRAIFVAIMSASDCADAYLRLMKLQLKKKQEFEIPKVLIHCSGAEKSYNRFYTLICKKLCGDQRLKKSFQFCLWDLFKQMGEEDGADDEHDDETEMDTRHVVNLAKMFGELLVEGGIGLSALKNLNLSYLQPKTKIFIEVFLITVLLESQRESKDKRDAQAVSKIMSRVKDTPGLVVGLLYFLKKVVRKTDIAGGKEEKKTVKWAVGVVCDTLEGLEVVGG